MLEEYEGEHTVESGKACMLSLIMLFQPISQKGPLVWGSGTSLYIHVFQNGRRQKKNPMFVHSIRAWNKCLFSQNIANYLNITSLVWDIPPPQICMREACLTPVTFFNWGHSFSLHCWVPYQKRNVASLHGKSNLLQMLHSLYSNIVKGETTTAVGDTSPSEDIESTRLVLAAAKAGGGFSACSLPALLPAAPRLGSPHGHRAGRGRILPAAQTSPAWSLTGNFLYKCKISVREAILNDMAIYRGIICLYSYKEKLPQSSALMEDLIN